MSLAANQNGSGQPRDERSAAWSAAKLAVRRYAHEPSEANAGMVQSAWRQVRRAMTAAVDQRMRYELRDLSERARKKRTVDLSEK